MDALDGIAENQEVRRNRVQFSNIVDTVMMTVVGLATPFRAAQIVDRRRDMPYRAYTAAQRAIGEAITARSIAIDYYQGLGPPDLCCVTKQVCANQRCPLCTCTLEHKCVRYNGHAGESCRHISARFSRIAVRPLPTSPIFSHCLIVTVQSSMASGRRGEFASARVLSLGIRRRLFLSGKLLASAFVTFPKVSGH